MRRIVNSVRLNFFAGSVGILPAFLFPGSADILPALLMEVEMKCYYTTEDEIRTLVESFEACSFDPADFRHYQHLAVALWYVWHLPLAEAAEKITTGIRRLAETYGRMGYHETITLFWLRIVAAFVSEHADLPLPALANALIDNCCDKDFIGRYYSADLITSPRAKAEWVEPDLQTLPEIAEHYVESGVI